MFWALAGVTFSAAKIVGCNKNFFLHGLPSTLLQLFYFTCSGVSKISYGFLVHGLLGQQVPQHDVQQQQLSPVLLLEKLPKFKNNNRPAHTIS
jgi:hypothetical protein